MSGRHVLWGLQGLLVGLPLFVGGRNPVGFVAAGAVALVLLVATVRARRARPADAAAVPGLALLAGFVALALLTTVPLPPALLGVLSPSAVALYRDVLPGWPDGGGWSVWRALSLDPYATWSDAARVGIGFATYAVVAGYPWGDLAERTRVLGRLLLALVCGGTAFAALGVFFEATQAETVLGPFTDEPVVYTGRATGPFVNPNHLATWLEMVIPLGLAFAAGQVVALRRRIAGAADTGHRLGVLGGRAWVTALVTNQARLVAPLLAVAALLLTVVGLLATQSRGGTAGLLIGLGVTAAGLLARRARRSHGLRVAAVAAGVLLVVGCAGTVLLWASADADLVSESDSVDASFQQRLAVNAQAPALIADFPLLGTGLGTWLHAFRPYQSPPVDSGIWDHAHNDYLELLAETGVAGFALALAFAATVVGYLWRSRRAEVSDERARAERRRSPIDDDFEVPAWRAALEDRGAMAWGLAGGVTAVMLHALVEFGLYMPANLVLLMALLGCLVLCTAPQPSAARGALLALLVVYVLAALPLGVNRALLVAGGMPLSPDDALDGADLMVAEDGESRVPEALALVRHAIDRAPSYREAHEQLASLLDGPESDAALRVALRIEPWNAVTRETLALQLWQRGEREVAVRELEESIYRQPDLERHGFLSPDLTPEAPGHDQVIRALAEGDTLAVRLATLDPALVAAVERGLERASDETPPGPRRTAIVADRVTLLEARERWAEAGDLLAAEAKADPSDLAGLARAARAYLKVGDTAKAEEALLAALMRTPERGDLYKQLAVNVYAARGDYTTAEKVLAGGERNAVDRMPVYDAVTQVIAGRETAWAESLLVPGTARAGERK